MSAVEMLVKTEIPLLRPRNKSRQLMSQLIIHLADKANTDPYCIM